MNLPIIQAIKGLRVGNDTKVICIIKKVFENEKFKDWVLYENIDQILPNIYIYTMDTCSYNTVV